MKKYHCLNGVLPIPFLLKYLLLMKIAVFLVLVFGFQSFAFDGFSQKRIDLDLKSISIPDVLSKIESQYEYRFVYNEEVKNSNVKVDVYAKRATIDYVMQQLLLNTAFSYKKINNGLVVVIGRPHLTPKLLINGKVLNDHGLPLSGASIIEKGTTNGTTTGEDGNFSIEVTDENAVLLVSAVGYMSREISVKDDNYTDIVLLDMQNEMEEIVVVGYGTQKKINTTGAIATIESKQFIQSPVANLSNSMVGRVPGLFAIQSSGEPGYDQSKIYIRGVGTFTGNTDPLVLVDGIEVSNYNNIDPNEIESVSLLKDASSTAVYGIRGANGVIIITTKRGKTGPPVITYTFNQGFNSFVDLRKSMTSSEVARNYNQAQIAEYYVSGNYRPLRYSPADIELYENGQDPIFHPNIDWADYMFRKYAPQSQHNITVSGGQERVKYFVSSGFFNQEGMYNDFSDLVSDYSPQSSFKRVNLRSNFNFEITRRLKMILDLSLQTEARKGNNNDNNAGAESSGSSRLMSWIFKTAALAGPGVVDGKLVKLAGSADVNPIQEFLFPANIGGVRRNNRNYLNGLLRLDYDLDFLLKGLSTHANVAIQNYNDQSIINSKRVVVYTAVKLPDGSSFLRPENTDGAFTFSESGTYSRRVTSEFGFDYKRSFNRHNITALALYNQQKTYAPYLAFRVPKGYQSYVGRVTYDFANRYMAEVNVGYNGTENFAEDKRFGLFPAYSLGWVISNEPFFPKNNILTFFKVSGSYGEVGNDNIGGDRFLYRPTSYTNISNIYYFGEFPSTYFGYNGVMEGATGNPNVTWERAVKKNLRIESRLLNNKLDFTVDLWNELRDDILWKPSTYSLITGLIQPSTNLGKMENHGYEAIITFKNNIGQLGYRVSANYSFARNKILFMDEVSNRFSYQNLTGYRYGQHRVLLTDGIFNSWEEVNDASRPVYSMISNKIQPGDFKYRDINADGIIDGFDFVPYGYSTIPEKTFGFNLALDFKGVDFSILFQGAANVTHPYTITQKSAGFDTDPYKGTARYLNQSWSFERLEQGLPIDYPRFAINSPNGWASDFFLADASYLRLKNMEIGYNFLLPILQRLRINSLRVYANANNLLTWSNMYPGVDPETIQIGDGFNYEPYPQVRTMNFGINVRF